MKPLPDLGRLAGAGAALTLGILAQRTLTSSGNPWDGVLLYALAGFLFVLAIRGTRLPGPSPPEEVWSRLPLRERPRAAAFLAASLVLAGGSLYLFDTRPSPWAWAAFVGSLGGFLAGLAVWEGVPKRLRGFMEGLKEKPVPWREGMALAAIVVLALAVRTFSLETLPFGLYFDEAVNGLDAREVLTGGKTPVYFPQNFGRGAPFIYGVAASFRIFGESIWALRSVAALGGAAAVLAFYALVRALFGSRDLALVGALLLATSRWHLNFSRIAFDGILVPLVLILTLLFLWRGLRSGSLTEMALGGIALGLGLHTHASARLVPFAIAAFAAIWLVTHQDRWRRDMVGWGILIFAAFLAFAPLGLYAYREPDSFLDRTRAASIFQRRDSTGVGEALVHNVGAHLAMFNLQGDRNGRHNLPGEPMVDPLSGVLLVLGVATAASRLRDPRYQLILLTGVTLLQGGILSLDFEAPQSLRSIGVLPSVYLLALLPVAAIAELYRSDLSPRWGRGALIVSGIALAFIVGHNGYTYFLRQARDFASWNAFSTAQTIVAREMAELGSRVRFYVSNHFAGHPTLRFLAADVGQVQVFRQGDHVPIPGGGPEGAVLYLDERREVEFRRAQDWYPEAVTETVRPPFGGPQILYRVVMSPVDVSGPQGLVASYRPAEIVEGPDVSAISRREGPIDFDWSAEPPLSEPFLVRWEGSLRVPLYGPYRLRMEAPEDAEIWIDGKSLASGSGGLEVEVTLAEGLHPIALEAAGGAGIVRLSWQPPDREEIVTIPLSALYGPPVRSEGLLGRYFPNAEWAGRPALERIDPDLSIYWQEVPLPRPYTVEWTGMLLAPTGGIYQFATDSVDGSTLSVAGQTIVRNPGGGGVSGTVSLQAGLHPITLLYRDQTHHTYVELTWTAPGAAPEVIPSQYLLPPRGSYPPLETLLAELGILPSPTQEPVEMEVEESWGGFEVDTPFEDPRGVGVGDDGTVYVIDSALGRLGRFDDQGRLLGGWSDPEWIEPSDLAVDRRGRVYVLDAGAGALFVYDAEGTRLALWGTEFGWFRPRGMGLDGEEVWVADTGGSRLVRISLEGALLGEIAIPMGEGGQASQPTDVAVDAAGRIYVSDPENQRLLVLDSTGRAIRSWPIPRSDTVRGGHLFVGPDAAIYLSDPWGGFIRRFDPEGRLLSEVALPRSEGGPAPMPVGIAVSGDGTVYLADPGSRLVWVLEARS